jgi:hypothetical protein
MDLMDVRREMMGVITLSNTGRLPSAYQQIDYLLAPSTHDAYIPTDFVPSGSMSIEFDFIKTGVVDGDSSFFFGTTGGTGVTAYALQLFNGISFYGNCNLSRYANVFFKNYQTNSRIHVELDDNNISVNDGTVAITQPTSRNETTVIVPPLCIFARNRIGIEYIAMNLGIYYLKFKNGNNLVANFIPCIRKSDNEPGMYDTVTQKFYTNAGTGEFIVPQ